MRGQLNKYRTKEMITKGTPEYKLAQEVANNIKRTASYQRWNDNTMFRLMFDPFSRFLSEIAKLNVFASQVAESVDKTMNPQGFKLASVSDKQAWILACAAIENNVNVEF